MIPRATYRMQFHKDFTFADAQQQVAYLARLGISHIYASPILTARRGSLHGYDVVNHGEINPELGGERAFRDLAASLRQRGMGIILDIVPNHMAVGGADNRWWLDVLTHGRESAFSTAFDIDWDAPGLDGKILAPFLNGQPQLLWERGELTLRRDDGGWHFAYYEHRFPLRPQDQARALPPVNWHEVSQLLAHQHYQFADWREANSRINWRRFFDITGLAALRMTEPVIFEAVHAIPLSLYSEGLIDGLRIDHIDGLAEPASYCCNLRNRLEALRSGSYLIVEKILAEGESLPRTWCVDGTTGYDVMNEISALLHADDGGYLEQLWHEVSGRELTFDQEENNARQEVLSGSFAAQFEGVQRAFLAVLPGVPESYVRSELTNLIVGLRGYRSYATGTALSPGPGKTLYQALLGTSVLAPIFSARDGNPAIIEALRKFHQLTAPVAAKAVEDTAFYRYGRLLSRNDVGFNPVQVFLDPNTFHDRVRARARDFPHSMLTTATHDHKRGEDARARLAVLSAKPAVWQDFLRQAPWPPELHPADVYVLYQTLLGSWPPVLDESFALRVENWCRKHLREGKLRSNWFEPNLRYEDLLCSFSRQLILDNSDFVSRMTALIELVKPEGDQNSIVQLVLKYTLPGVPDLYQGCEFSDFSLVDPDNRRPVDYRARSKELNPALEFPTSLDRRKQAAIVALLNARRRFPALWERGSYEPIPVAEGYLAFKRQLEEESICTLVRVHSGASNTAFQIPFSGYDILTGRHVEPGDIVGSGLLRKDISWAMVVRNPTWID